MARVFVGMSGGVDSSLAAALLLESGHEVVGVYMKNWTQDLPGMVCPWADDLADTKRVAVHLGIPLRVYDFQAEYKQRVVDYMINEYRAGRTPNPDIMCNQEVKFKLFLETALHDGAEMIATGHYARVSRSPDRLMQAVDTNKDQTYFLYRVSVAALAKTLFPLGNLTKRAVRQMAEKRGLATASKPDSQGICFVGSVGIKDFLGEFVGAKPGDIVDAETNQVVGQHDGAIYYTVGQRHGMSVGGGLPYYVIAKDMKHNRVYVSRKLDHDELWRQQIPLDDLHWINTGPADGVELRVRLRHRGPLLAAQLQGSVLHLSEPQRAINPGQSAVFYSADECLGGGIIC